MLERATEEPAGDHQITLPQDQDVDDLVELVNRSIQADPSPGDFDVGLVNGPAITGACRKGRDASIADVVNRYIQRKIVTRVKPRSYTAR